MIFTLVSVVLLIVILVTIIAVLMSVSSKGSIEQDKIDDEIKSI